MKTAKRATQILDELLAHLKESRPGVVLDEDRFRMPALLDLLLEEGQAALPFEPARADEIAEVALLLAKDFEDDSDDLAGRLVSRCRLYCLSGTAKRLLGEQGEAQRYFDQVMFMDVEQTARASYCKGLGLLRWDQGRYEEAGALLYRAARHYEGPESREEQGACLAWAGLFALDRLAYSEAEKLLTNALPKLDAERWRWLSCKALLGFGLALAERWDDRGARTARKHAWRLYEAPPPNEEAMAGLHWLEGRLAGVLGDAEDALHLLDSVRRRYLAAGRLPEATLATLDLAEILAQTRRTAKITVLVEEFADAFEGQPGYELAIDTLMTLEAEALSGPLDHAFWVCLGSALRLLFPQQGVFFQPVPFA